MPKPGYREKATILAILVDDDGREIHRTVLNGAALASLRRRTEYRVIVQPAPAEAPLDAWARRKAAEEEETL